MPGSLTRGGGENVPGIPGECATRNFTYLIRGPLSSHSCYVSASCLCVTYLQFTKILYMTVCKIYIPNTSRIAVMPMCSVNTKYLKSVTPYRINGLASTKLIALTVQNLWSDHKDLILLVTCQDQLASRSWASRGLIEWETWFNAFERIFFYI